jgi:hypothetical protein
MRIRYLLLHAYGTGGTTRTVFNQANSMVAAGHEVELVSVLRRRDMVRFPLDRRVTVRALIDDLGFDTVDAGGLDDSWRQQPGTPVYGMRADVGTVTEALAQASPERPADFRG